MAVSCYQISIVHGQNDFASHPIRRPGLLSSDAVVGDAPTATDDDGALPLNSGHHNGSLLISAIRVARARSGFGAHRRTREELCQVRCRQRRRPDRDRPARRIHSRHLPYQGPVALSKTKASAWTRKGRTTPSRHRPASDSKMGRMGECAHPSRRLLETIHRPQCPPVCCAMALGEWGRWTTTWGWADSSASSTIDANARASAGPAQVSGRSVVRPSCL